MNAKVNKKKDRKSYARRKCDIIGGKKIYEVISNTSNTNEDSDNATITSNTVKYINVNSSIIWFI